MLDLCNPCLQSLSASAARIQTANGKIVGKFEVEDSLELTTANQPISATITMRNRNESRPTRLDMRTTNSYVDFSSLPLSTLLFVST